VILDDRVYRLEGEVAALEARKPAPLGEKERRRLLQLGADLELAWSHSAATAATRKRILRAALYEIVVRIEGRLHRDGPALAGRRPHCAEAEDEWSRQASLDAAARQLGVEAAPHRLDNVVERQHEAAAQLDDQGLSPGGDRGGQAMRAGRAVGDVAAGFPARHGTRMDAELACQRGVRGGTLLDVGAGARRGGGIGV
jgi:hypothetical protein